MDGSNGSQHPPPMDDTIYPPGVHEGMIDPAHGVPGVDSSIQHGAQGMEGPPFHPNMMMQHPGAPMDQQGSGVPMDQSHLGGGHDVHMQHSLHEGNHMDQVPLPNMESQHPGAPQDVAIQEVAMHHEAPQGNGVTMDGSGFGANQEIAMYPTDHKNMGQDHSPVPAAEDGFAVDEESGLGVKKDSDVDTMHHHEAPMSPSKLAESIAGVSPEELTNVVLSNVAYVENNTTRAPVARKPRVVKPVKKVLVAKKESDLAVTFLNGKRDLADTLTEKDCFFLAKAFWVFTHDQLDFLLKRALDEEQPFVEGVEPKKFYSRDQILGIIEGSDIIEPKEEGSGETMKDEDGKGPETVPTKMETGEGGTGIEESSDRMDIDQEPLPNTEAPLGVVTGPGASDFYPSVSSEVLRAAAISKLGQWKDLLEEAKGKESKPIGEAFSISGAISCALTPTTINFLTTVKIKTLFAFMSLKKTETGAICEYIQKWRVKCSLPPLTLLGAAKYLLGVNSRLEAALSSIPPVDEEKRHWMMDSIIVMTGAAREFLIEDQRILTAFDFIHTRTKDLSLALAAWRQKKGFVPLKGSGKVAMISGWKATAKEVLEVEAGVGRVLEEDELDGLVLGDIPLLSSGTLFSQPKVATSSRPIRATAAPTPEQKEVQIEPVSVSTPVERTPRLSMTAAKKRLSSSRKQSDYDLHSKMFLDDVLGEEETDVLASVDIHTAAQLLETDDQTRALLADEVVEAQIVDEIGEADAKIEKWMSLLKEELGMKDASFPRKRARTSTPKKARASESSSGKSKKTKSHSKIVKPEDTKNVTDPFDLLSAVTKRFLATIGISTAEQFLTTRTTDIAAEFVAFRKKEGMTELKGLGSIASVSGWKANCRKYCKNMGWDETAEMEPPDKLSTKGEGQASATKVKDIIKLSSKTKPQDDDELPFKAQRVMFGVQGDKDFPLQFRFDVSLRKSVEPSKREQDIFVTFKGSSQRSAQEDERPTIEYMCVDAGGSIEKRAVLQDALLTRGNDRSIDARATFKSSQPGCGLVDMSKHGVKPLVDQDLSALKSQVRSFVLAEAVGEEMSYTKPCAETNIVVKRSSFENFQYLLHIGETMEAGQTCPLSFPSVAEMLKTDRFAKSDFSQFHLLVEAFHVLSKSDVRSLISYFSGEILRDIGLENILESLTDTQDLSDDAEKEKLMKALESRSRLHWLSCHLFGLTRASSTTEERERELLYFGVYVPSNVEDLSSSIVETMKDKLSIELSVSLLGLLDLDSACGGSQRKNWCPIAIEFFDGLISVVANWQLDYPSKVKTALVEKYDRISALEFKPQEKDRWTFKVSPLPDGFKKEVVVCSGRGGRSKEVEVGSFSDEDDEISIDWYKSFLLQIMYKIIHACGFLLNGSDFPTEAMLGHMKSLDGQSDLTGVEYGLPAGELFPYTIKTMPIQVYQPQSYQFFLGIVWPTLREFGWRVEVVKYPNETKYIAPQWKGDQIKHGKLAKLAKQQRDRRRADLARGVNQMGLGTLPKMTKRLFVAAKPTEKQGCLTEKKMPSTKHVGEILELFLKEKFDGTGKLHGKAKGIIELLLQCFDEQAPSICKEANNLDLDVSEKPRDSCAIDIFIQFLLLMPSLLTQSDLPLQEINDSLQIVQDLTGFCSSFSSVLLPEGTLPPEELYTTAEKFTYSNLAERLTRCSESGGNDELTEVIWEEDKEVLSDFVVTVMEQVIACRATVEDTARKNRKIHVGYPGAVCRHCMGQKGDGRYFFTSIESVTTLGTVFEKHIAKCTLVPSEVKKAMLVTKAKHHEQRKSLPNGSQQAYFLKLWDRLRTMRISGDSGSGVPITQAAMPDNSEEKSSENGEEAGEKIEFTEPLQVLDFVRTTVPWKGTKEIDDALNQYYTCIDFGGRIFNTRGMPKHFSPAWLLARVGPKQTKKKKFNLPG